MALSYSALVKPLQDNSIQNRFFLSSNDRNSFHLSISSHNFSVGRKCFPSPFGYPIMLYGGFANLSQKFCGFKYWVLDKLNLENPNGNCELGRDSSSKRVKVQESVEQTKSPISRFHGSSLVIRQQIVSTVATRSPLSVTAKSYGFDSQSPGEPSLSIAVIGATGELARTKIFPALFALYYSGFLPENVGIFGYSRKNINDEDLRAKIASTLTCRIDHQQNCEKKMDAFLSRTYYVNGGYDNREGMAKLNAKMEESEDGSEANRIFYLSVPQEALLDVASSVAANAQSKRGWNRIIIEKPFGYDATSSNQLTRSLLMKFEEKQLYRIDHRLGRNLIENLTVLRFSNLVFEPLWSRAYIRNVQIIISEDGDTGTSGRDVNDYGIIQDIVHSHILQTIALFAMEPPITLDDEDVRNEKVKVLRSIRRLELSDIILGQYKSSSEDKVDIYLDTLTPTFFAAALYIDNARWDGVPFLIKAGTGLIKHRMEIRIQFHNVPGNLYRERIGQSIDLATNELILRGVPDEAILVKINNKIPGLGLQLDASELNLLYKDKYNVEVPDSYEHLLLDVIDGDHHLFMRSDALAAAWDILTLVLNEIDAKRIAPELYEFGGRGPVGAYYLAAKHGVRWADD